MNERDEPMKGLADRLHRDVLNIRAVVPTETLGVYGQAGYRIGHRDARHAAAELVIAALAEVEASRQRSAVGAESDGNLNLVWNTLRFFCSESSYTTGERTGGVLAGCSRDPAPTVAEMAQYARWGMAALQRFLGQESEAWLLDGSPVPAAPPSERPAAPAKMPLSEERIKEIARWNGLRDKSNEPYRPWRDSISFARAIESAHGISGESSGAPAQAGVTDAEIERLLNAHESAVRSLSYSEAAFDKSSQTHQKEEVAEARDAIRSLLAGTPPAQSDTGSAGIAGVQQSDGAKNG